MATTMSKASSPSRSKIVNARNRKRARRVLHHLIGMAAEIGHDRIGLRFANRGGERGRGERDEGFQVRYALAKRRV